MNKVRCFSCGGIKDLVLGRKASSLDVLKRRCFHQSHRCFQDARSLRKKNAGEKGYALLIIPFTTFCLGTWQVQRRKWKLNLISDLESRTSAPPIPFPLDLGELNDLEYRTATLSGEFDHDKEMYVLPRSPVAEETTGGLVGAGPSKSGANVITPFKVADRELTILVNRGWVPRNKIDPNTRLQGQVTGEIELTGVIRKTEQRKPFAAKNDAARNRWFHRDAEAMAESVGADPIFIDATQETTVPGGPLGGQTRVTLRNEHFSYIVTWYTLSAFTAFMWFQKYMR